MRILEVKSISKKFGDFYAVKDFSFSVEKGEIYGILGPNGAGKTTTIRMLLDIFKPDSGEIKIFGENFKEEHKAKIGYLPEERGLPRKMKLIDVLFYLGELKGRERKFLKEKIYELTEILSLKEWLYKKVEELSKGMQQKAQFIGAILHDPEVVIFDEPFSGLDPINTEALLEIMLDLKSKGKTILFSTHILEHAEKLLDSITIIKEGKNMLSGNLNEVKKKFSGNYYKIVVEKDEDKNKITKLKNTKSIRAFGNEYEIEFKDGITSETILKNIVEEKIGIKKFEKVEPSLLSIYFNVIEREDIS